MMHEEGAKVNEDDLIGQGLTTFECYELSRLYKHLSKVTSRDSKLSPEKLTKATRSFTMLEDNISKIVALTIRAVDLVELHHFSLSMYPALRELHLNRCPPSTIDDFYELRGKLLRLEIINSGIPALYKALVPAPAKYLKAHKPLFLGEERISPPRAYIWTKLKLLRLTNCGIAKMDASFHFMPHLAQLDISHNDISNLIHLQDCFELRILNASHNRISVLSNISRVIPNIVRLNLSNNMIESLDGLSKLTALEKLDLSNNHIDDFMEIEELVVLPHLHDLILEGNAISFKASYRQSVFVLFVHDCSRFGKPFPLLDNTPITELESTFIKGTVFLPPRPADNADKTDNSLKFLDEVPVHILDRAFQKVPSPETTASTSVTSAAGSTAPPLSIATDLPVAGTATLLSTKKRSSRPRRIANVIDGNAPSPRSGLNTSAPPSPMRFSTKGSESVLSATESDDAYLSLPSADFTYSPKISAEERMSEVCRTEKSRQRSRDMTSLVQSLHGSEDEVSISLKAQNLELDFERQRRAQRRSMLMQKLDEHMEKFATADEQAPPVDTPTVSAQSSVEALSTIPSSDEIPGNTVPELVTGDIVVDTSANLDVKPSSISDRQDRVEPNENIVPPSAQEVESQTAFVAAEIADSHSMENIGNESATAVAEVPAEIETTKASSDEANPAVDSTRDALDDMLEFERDSMVSNNRLSTAQLSTEKVAKSSSPLQADIIPCDAAPSCGDISSSPLNDEVGLSKGLSTASSDSKSEKSAQLSGDKQENEATDNSFIPTTSKTSSVPPVVEETSKEPEKVEPAPATTTSVNKLGRWGRMKKAGPAAKPSPPTSNTNVTTRVVLSSGVPKVPPPRSVDGTEVTSASSDDVPTGPTAKTTTVTRASTTRFSEQYGKTDTPSYTGPVDFVNLSVHDHLDMYFREQVFGHDRPSGASPYMRYLDSESYRSDTAYINPCEKTERFIALYREQMIDMSGGESGEAAVPMVFVLTDMTWYMVIDNFSSMQKFVDAPIPILYRSHPLDTLSVCTIFFGFQRCCLEFHSHADEASSATRYVSRYMILTRDKARTHPIVTTVPPLANTIRLAKHPPLNKVKIQNTDGELLDSVVQIVRDLDGELTDVVHYQMLYQYWKKRADVSVPRSIIITPTFFLLCEENLSSIDVQLKLIDHVAIKDVRNIRSEDDPLELTILIKPSSRLKLKDRRWRLRSDTRAAMSRVRDECRKACADLGVDV